MVISLIEDTISALKSARNITKSLLDLKAISEVQVNQAKVIELQAAILSAQDSAFAANAHQTAMIKEIRDLKEEIARIKAWEEEKQRYKLVYAWAGTMLYALKKECSTSEKPHWICTNCYEDGRKSILNPQIKARCLMLVCPRCKAEFHSPYHRMDSFIPECAPE
jgi:Zn finger protein HypA/HybF involved in hydrogenase expression